MNKLYNANVISNGIIHIWDINSTQKESGLDCNSKIGLVWTLMEYYEIVDEARPLSGFFPTHADFFTEMHF